MSREDLPQNGRASLWPLLLPAASAFLWMFSIGMNQAIAIPFFQKDYSQLAGVLQCVYLIPLLWFVAAHMKRYGKWYVGLLIGQIFILLLMPADERLCQNLQPLLAAAAFAFGVLEARSGNGIFRRWIRWSLAAVLIMAILYGITGFMTAWGMAVGQPALEFYRMMQMRLGRVFGDGLYFLLTPWIAVFLMVSGSVISLIEYIKETIAVHGATQALALRLRIAGEESAAIRSTIERTRIIKHEFRHHIAMLELLLKQGNYEKLYHYIAQLSEEGASVPALEYTENPIVNGILAIRLTKAAEQGIAIRTDIKLPERLDISDADLCGFLMNLLDNAIDACERLSPEDCRFIELRMNMKNDTLLVYCKNSKGGPIRSDTSGRLLTTKGSREEHGYGILAMKNIVGKYDGELETEYNEETFTVHAALMGERRDGKSNFM